MSERHWTECNGQAKTIMRRCILACVNKTLLLVHPRNCRLKPVDYFPVSCGSYVYLLVISQSLDSILWYIILYLHFITLFLHYISSFLFNKTALLSANPQIQEFFFMSIIMIKNRLHSNSLSSKKSKAFFLFNSHLVSMVQTDPDII